MRNFSERTLDAKKNCIIFYQTRTFFKCYFLRLYDKHTFWSETFCAIFLHRTSSSSFFSKFKDNLIFYYDLKTSVITTLKLFGLIISNKNCEFNFPPSFVLKDKDKRNGREIKIISHLHYYNLPLEYWCYLILGLHFLLEYLSFNEWQQKSGC